MNFFQMKKTFWFLSPLLVGFFLIFISQVPFSLLPGYHQSFPFITGLIFYFAVFNPKRLNVFFVFLLGLTMDLLSSVALGFYTFGFICLFFMANLSQSYLINMTFKQLWVVYALMLFFTDVIWAFLFFLISGIWVATAFWTVQYVFTALSYPLFCRLYGFLNRKTLEVA